MNYLAHARLSFDIPDILSGNMISDHVKGKKQYDYPVEILRGIRLHRAIDAFTDIHPATAAIKEFFRPAYRLYSGAFADIVYDYFLANDKNEFQDEAALMLYSEKTYTTLSANLAIYPERFQEIFPYMVKYNWLYHYRFDEGIQKSFRGMVHRSKYIHESDTAFRIFLENKQAMQQSYDIFYPSVKSFAWLTLEQLNAE